VGEGAGCSLIPTAGKDADKVRAGGAAMHTPHVLSKDCFLCAIDPGHVQS
jgi:hypothetical protein